MTQAAAVGTGTYQTVCLLSDDTLFSWGPQAMGLLGGGAVETLAEVPKQRPPLPQRPQVTFQEETAAWVPWPFWRALRSCWFWRAASRKERVGVRLKKFHGVPMELFSFFPSLFIFFTFGKKRVYLLPQSIFSRRY